MELPERQRITTLAKQPQGPSLLYAVQKEAVLVLTPLMTSTTGSRYPAGFALDDLWLIDTGYEDSIVKALVLVTDEACVVDSNGRFGKSLQVLSARRVLCVRL